MIPSIIQSAFSMAISV